MAERATRELNHCSKGCPVEPKVEAIVAAARTLFAARGFDATSVHDIAARAGVAAGTIIYHFKTKENLLFIIARQALAGLLRALAREVDVAAGPWEALAGMTGAFFRYARVNIESLHVLFREDPFLRFDVCQYPMADLVMLEKRCADLIAMELEHGFNSGVFRPVPLPETTTVIRAMWIGCAQSLTRDPSMDDPSAEVVAFLAGRLLPPGPAAREPGKGERSF